MSERRSGVSRAARVEDLPALAVSLASAFHEDPLWGQWAFPDASTRAERLAELMRAWAAAAIRYPWVRVTGRAASVAVWIPPGQAEMTLQQEADFHALVGDLLGERARELEALFASFSAHHPEEPHYYLSLWGTRRDHAGKGLGTALLRENLASIDAERMPAYLESTNPANVARYEALGFEPRSEFGPPGGPVITTMWREPR